MAFMMNRSQNAEKEVQETSWWSAAGGWGYPPASIFPQDWGIKGVDKDFFSNLLKDNQNNLA